MGTAPVADLVAYRWNAKYVFIKNDDQFERARSLNVGSALAEHDLILWTDNDLLAPARFIEAAAHELRARDLDYLVPYASISYLSEADSSAVMDGARNPAQCAPVKTLLAGRHVSGGAGLVKKDFLARHGGLSEGFRGWGGEDNAWAHKARLLGRSGITGNRGQRLFHLHHANSTSGPDFTAHTHNPYYARNVALLNEMCSVRHPDQFVQRFPAPAASCPWARDKRVAFVALEQTSAAEDSLAAKAGRGLKELFSIDVIDLRAGEDTLLGELTALSPDAVVLFGTHFALRVLALPGFAPLRPRAVIVADAAEALTEADVELLRHATALTADARSAAALRRWRTRCFVLPPNGCGAAALGIALTQPLSIALGSACGIERPTGGGGR